MKSYKSMRVYLAFIAIPLLVCILSGTVQAAPKTLLTQIQGMTNESGSPPSNPSEPWLTVAVENITSDGADVALERSQVNSGTVAQAETIGYLAIEAGKRGNFTVGGGQSINYITQLTAPAITGWSNGCTRLPFNSSFSGAPLVLASQASHKGHDGGWLRRCGFNTKTVGLTVDEDLQQDAERGHTKEAVSMVVFSKPFSAEFSTASERWRIEAGSIPLDKTFGNQNFTQVQLKQTYGQTPVVFVLPSSQGPDPASIRIRNVSSNGFEIAQVEPPGSDGAHAAMTVHYMAITPGRHNLPDGVQFEASTISTQAVQHGSGVPGANGWQHISFTGTPSPPPPSGGGGFTQQDAARFLTQATFGPTLRDITHLTSLGNREAWLEEQFSKPMPSHLYRVQNKTPGAVEQNGRVDVWWDIAVRSDDQLRQRIAFALSEILVVSDVPDALYNYGNQLAAYYDVLARNSFDNYRKLLEDVTLSSAMGVYLSMLGNDKPDPETGRRADENYAREVMQLFSIGLTKLNLNGGEKLINGKPVPTFNQTDIENIARVFTGWSWATSSFEASWWPNRDILARPMKAFEAHHDQDVKKVLGVTLPAGQSAKQDLKATLDIIFNHPNVGPFIGKQLIQRLVTSNPTPAYVARVASRFNDNGQGVRGDMKSVIKAILLDEEARNGHLLMPTKFGKLREPMLRVSHLWRAFKARGGPSYSWTKETYNSFHYHWADYYFTQAAPLRAPSVFNYFQPNFSPTGKLKNAKMTAPEFQIATESRIKLVYDALMSFVDDDGLEGVAVAKLDLGAEKALLPRPEKLIDHLDLLLLSGGMSEALKQMLVDYATRNQTFVDKNTMVRQLIKLIITSAEYAIQR